MKVYSLLLAGSIANRIYAQECHVYGFTLELQNECSLAALQEAYAAYLAAPENQILSQLTSCGADHLDTLLIGQNVEDLCANASDGDGLITFDDIVQQPDGKFVESFYRGNTYWNEEVQTNYELDDPNGPATNVLKNDIGQVPEWYKLAEQKRVKYPDYLDNFDLDNCDINAVMCCWPLDRQANDNNGNCATPYDTNCVDKDPADNTDICGVHLDRGRTSTNLHTDGFTVLEGDDNDGEGATHCHGFAFSNNVSDAETRYMGNNLFYISMYDHLYKRGYARNIPGAPMCGCVEQMPVVTRSDCTQVDVIETFTFVYDPSIGFSVITSDVDIEFNACQGLNNNNNDLSAYVARLETEGKVTLAQKNELKKHLVEKGNCENAIERNLASAGIVRGFADNAYEETYYFPPTDTDQFVHGICVLGASNTGAFSDTDFDLDYTVIHDFKDGVKLWGDRDYVSSGIQGDSMCEGGIYLQPTRHKTINRFADITFGADADDGGYVEMCAFVISSDERTGKWDEVLPNERFRISNEFTWTDGSTTGKMRSYCKTLPEPPTSAPSIQPSRTPPDVSYDFPSVQTSQFVHGICFLGASYAEASSTDPNLSYTLAPNFQDSIKLWGDRNYVTAGIVGDAMCQGGIYLEPSLHKSIAAGTDIKVEANSIDGGYVEMCALLISGDGRTGKWDEVLPSDRFRISDEFTWTDGSISGKMRSYCKTLPEPPTASPSEAPSRIPSDDVSYEFPPVQTSQFVHGICVLGASHAEASSTDPNLSYTSISNFQDGTKLWHDRGYVVAGIVGDAMCQGGIYLTPSRHKSIAQNTNISFQGEAISADGARVSLCVFLMSSDSRTGKWDTILPTEGFKVSAEFSWGDGMGKMRSYCKKL